MTNRYEGLNKWIWCTMSEKKTQVIKILYGSPEICDAIMKIKYTFLIYYNDFKNPRSQRIGIVDMVGKLLYRLCCEKKLSECALK